jgi:DNA-binding transcriptional ArsR family regulator
MKRGAEIMPGMQPKAAEAAGLLRLLGNDKRLLVLCHLADGEKGVGALAEAVGLSQSALSQHLAMLRDSGLVATRRQAQAVFYHLADPKAAEVLGLLHRLYCRNDCH